MANNEVLIAQAWWALDDNSKVALRVTSEFTKQVALGSVVAVHGIPESELRELLERRGVCEVVKHLHDGPYEFAYINHPLEPSAYSWEDPRFCRYCGRRAVVKESFTTGAPND